MRIRLAVGLALGTIAATLLAAPPSAAATSINVMTRNLYLGADVFVALQKIPNMPAAAQFMWDQVHVNDFPTRARRLAEEAALEKPAVIAIQEATIWECRTGPLGGNTVIYDFLDSFLKQTNDDGVPYVLAEANGRVADNSGYAIEPIPYLTTVHDPETFQPIFGADDAQCGFVIGDALAVRSDLANQVLEAGTIEYDAVTTIIPVLMNVTRGYAWADIAIDGTPTRFVTTHLEAYWKPDSVPSSVRQAQQLVDDLAPVTMPLVVMGDFNSDPRDPRDPAANPGDQPEVSSTCPAQSGNDSTCSAYWTMVNASYKDAGPDSSDPANLSWGASAVLAGPDLTRLPFAQQMGNKYGFTDRLDYVFVRNGVTVDSAHLVGNVWPDAPDNWSCNSPEQVKNTKEAADAMQVRQPSGGVCFPTDHAGVVATLSIPESTADDRALSEHGNSRNWLPFLVTLAVGALIIVLLAALTRRRHGGSAS